MVTKIDKEISTQRGKLCSDLFFPRKVVELQSDKKEIENNSIFLSILAT